MKIISAYPRGYSRHLKTEISEILFLGRQLRLDLGERVAATARQQVPQRDGGPRARGQERPRRPGGGAHGDPLGDLRGSASATRRQGYRNKERTHDPSKI